MAFLWNPGLKAQTLTAAQLALLNQIPGMTSPMELAQKFLGRPYQTQALAKENPEYWHLDLNGFDCITLMDQVYALYVSQGSQAQYLQALQDIRYAGRSLRFEHRQHYFSAAAQHMVQTGKWKTVLPSSLLVHESRHLNVLSKSLQGKSLRLDLAQVQEMEKAISQQTFRYLPMAQLPKALAMLQDGDVLAMVAAPGKGIDVWHVGFAIKQGQEWHLLHASQSHARVEISPEPLAAYLKSKKQFIGIQLYRPLWTQTSALSTP